MDVYDFSARALKRVSNVYQHSAFIKNFYKAVGSTFELLRPYFEDFQWQSFNSTVDWGIDYREDIYSLEHATWLDLPARRERLKIKASTSIPLNPAVLEAALLNAYGVQTYLSEATAGYITIYLAAITPEQWRQVVDFLLEERPAHLALQSVQHLVTYIGEGADDPDPTLIIAQENIPLPKDEADKQNFSRMFAGTSETQSSEIEIKLGSEPNHLVEMWAGLGLGIVSEIFIDCETQPNVQIPETAIADLLIANGGLAR